jgi:solute carrier family 13 (sodium-dependent dicarboxylate transporter), member 2/3/5
MPIGATAIAIGLFQVIFMIRTPDAALKDFFDPSVWFIFGSVVMGLAFAVSGFTKRMAYKMLNIVGENTNFILLGTFLIIPGMTLLMAHTAVAAAIFPLLVAHDDHGYHLHGLPLNRILMPGFCGFGPKNLIQ